MAGKTVSAYADEGTAAKVAEMARVEDRSPAQIAAAALRFYVRLPQAARDAIRRLEAGSGKDTMDEAAWAAGRALIDKQYEASLTAGIAAGAAMLPADASEEDILTAAVDLSRRH